MDVQIRGETNDDYNIITEINDLAFGGTGESQLILKLRRTKNIISDPSVVVLVDD